MSPVSRGFLGRRRPVGDPSRLPPGQYVETGFPVLSAGPTPHTPLDEWSFLIDGEVDNAVSWPWKEFLELPAETVTVDIHCVTKWSKFDTKWKGVSVDTLLERRRQRGRVRDRVVRRRLHDEPASATTSATARPGWHTSTTAQPLHPEHGGPARLLVPHLYFWKSAKWVRGLTLTVDDEPGFWENYGYHNLGDPWLEQRYQGD